MTWLLDTVVVSESSRRSPDERVGSWLHAQTGVPLFVSVLTVGELRKGLVRMPDGPNRVRISEWLEDVILPTFEPFLLPVTRDVAETWGEMIGRAEAAGRIIPVEDGLIAATARVHGLTVVTRNVKDFESTGVRVLNPWEST